MDTTRNYGFQKPSEDDFYDINVTNANMDKVDGALRVIEDSFEGIVPITYEEINLIDNIEVELVGFDGTATAEDIDYILNN